MQAHLECGAALEPDAVLPAPVDAEWDVDRRRLVADDRAKKAVPLPGRDHHLEPLQIRAEAEIDVAPGDVGAEIDRGQG